MVMTSYGNRKLDVLWLSVPVIHEQQSRGNSEECSVSSLDQPDTEVSNAICPLYQMVIDITTGLDWFICGRDGESLEPELRYLSDRNP